MCLAYIEDRIARSKTAIDAARAAANEETKSSAGDKYETGRAMMQLEIEKHSSQLSESMKLKQALSQINPELVCDQVRPGALVKTDSGAFYISIPAAKLQHDGESYFAVSVASPIGTKMLDKKVNDVFELNGNTIRILKIG